MPCDHPSHHHHDSPIHICCGGHQPRTTHLVAVLDKSGSIADYGLVDAVITGYNEWLQDQQKLADANTRLTTILFDTDLKTLCEGIPVKDAPRLSRATYQAGGGTALNDAIGQAINRIEWRMLPHDRALIMVMTDGEENSSRQYKLVSQIRDMIRQHEQRGNWTFVFMRGGLDKQEAQAWANRTYGVYRQNSHGFNCDVAGMSATMASMSHGTRSYLASNAAAVQDFFSQGTVTGPVVDEYRKTMNQTFCENPENTATGSTLVTDATDGATSCDTTPSTTD